MSSVTAIVIGSGARYFFCEGTDGSEAPLVLGFGAWMRMTCRGNALH